MGAVVPILHLTGRPLPHFPPPSLLTPRDDRSVSQGHQDALSVRRSGDGLVRELAGVGLAGGTQTDAAEGSIEGTGGLAESVGAPVAPHLLVCAVSESAGPVDCVPVRMKGRRVSGDGRRRRRAARRSVARRRSERVKTCSEKAATQHTPMGVACFVTVSSSETWACKGSQCVRECGGCGEEEASLFCEAEAAEIALDAEAHEKRWGPEAGGSDEEERVVSEVVPGVWNDMGCREEVAAVCIQRAVRKKGRLTCSIEAQWVGKRAKRLGLLAAHVRFVQWVMRGRSALMRQGLKSRMAVIVCLRFGRRGRLTRCGGGKNLASEDEFAEVRDAATRMLDWYGQYVALLRRLLNGKTPSTLHAFCGGGGASEGSRRAGGASHGVDLSEMPEYVRRFGGETFTQGDATSWALVRNLQKKFQLLSMMAGPPCKWYSKARVKGAAREPPLIEIVRDQARALFEFWSIENVLGAREHMSNNSTLLTGFFFGLRVSRGRLFETSFEMHLDECMLERARRLEARTCLGARRRWRPFDEFGRPLLEPCCQGNIFSVTGESPSKQFGTLEECAQAMGVDGGHMSYKTLAQAIPPSYAQLVFAQLCMRQCERWFGVPSITFDERVRRPHWAQQTLAKWLRGAGGERPELGLGLVKAVEARAEGGSHSIEAGVAAPLVQSTGDRVGAGGAEHSVADAAADGAVPTRLAEARELNYTFAGGYTRQWVRPELAGRLEDGGCAAPFEGKPASSELLGENTFIEVGPAELSRAIPLLKEVVEAGVEGTRVTAVVRHQEAPLLRKLGFEYLPCLCEIGGGDALAVHGLVAMCVGRRKWAKREFKLDHDAVREYMDPRDQGGYTFDAERKQAAAWREMPWLPELWEGVGLPPTMEEGMRQGFEVDLTADPGTFEVPQYTWPSGEALMECIAETDRALAVGAMEFVPDEEVQSVREHHIVHPWTVAMKPKPRACQDYSAGTNRTARSKPFELPTVWDAAKVVGPDSHFCAYDLRDGFWSVPVRLEHRNKLVMRHPATGRLIRCARFPFGFKLSPFIFCGLTEAVGQILRKRLAGKGVHVFVYVDDWLMVGETREATQAAGVAFEELMEELGIEWAPHKQRGPCRCINFLGLLLCNVPGQQVVALTEARQSRLRDMLNEWLKKQPGRGEKAAEVEPKALASLLGHLVFASQCVPGGRTYLQAMLSSFAGLEIDWRRGLVRWARAGAWRLVALTAGFWRDLEWWSAHLERRNCMPMKRRTAGDAILAGTDASDWGTGQLVWLDGQREEVVLKFTRAEQRRSINWRELLGILRVTQSWGSRLAGRTVLIETDNMAAFGAASKGASSSEDMQELMRRMFEAAELWDINLRFVHTPGLLLDRPDQTSRGDPIEEPRVRLCANELAIVDARFGPFTEVLGAERKELRKPTTIGEGANVFMHPSYTTVGSALRRLGERLCEPDGATLSGIVVVPHDEAAGWWSMSKHFDVVGRWPAGSGQLEMNQMGVWRTVTSTRPTLILSFPRTAGGVIQPVACKRAGGGVDACLPLVQGSYIYSGAPKPGGRGVLYMVWKSYQPEKGDGSTGTPIDDDGAPLIRAAELLRVKKSGSSKDGTETYQLDRRAYRDGGSFTNQDRAWEVRPEMCWVVDHLVKAVGSSRLIENSTSRVLVGGAANKVAIETELKFTFNVKRAEQEIAAAAWKKAAEKAFISEKVSPLREERRTGLLGGAPNTEGRDKKRKDAGYQEHSEDECPICLEPLHATRFSGCGHRCHADITLDCCLCNTFKGPDDAHDLDAPKIQARRAGVQASLLRNSKALEDSWSAVRPAGQSTKHGRSRSEGLVVTVLQGVPVCEPCEEREIPIEECDSEGESIKYDSEGDVIPQLCGESESSEEDEVKPVLRATRSKGAAPLVKSAEVDFERELRRGLRRQEIAGERAARVGKQGRLVTPAPPAAPPPVVADGSPEMQQMISEFKSMEVNDEETAAALASARAAADLNAELRKKVPAPKPNPDALPKGAPAVKIEAGQAQPCRYRAMRCAGCAEFIGFGQPMWAAGHSMAHANEQCRSVAEEQLLRDIAEARTNRATIKIEEGAVKRATLFAHRLSVERVKIVTRCLEGECGEDEYVGQEPRTFCVRGCGRGVHYQSCCNLSTGKKALGLLICAHCRLSDVVGIGCRPDDDVMRSMVRAMIVEMTSGADSTAKGYSEFVRLEKEWQVSMVSGELKAEDVQMPHTSIEAFYLFTVWLVTDAQRARSLGNLMRSAGSYMVKLGYHDFTKTGRIKNLIRELELSSGALSTPCTQVTRAIVDIMMNNTLHTVCGKSLIGSKASNPAAIKMAAYSLYKARVTIDLELVGGLRIGETSGTKHGLLADDVVIQTLAKPEEAEPRQRELGETVEWHLEDSKTGGSHHGARWVTVIGTTLTSKLTTAADMRKLWEIQDIKIIKDKELGFMTERPDYSVVRVSLIDMNKSIFKKFMMALEDAPEPVALLAKSSKAIAVSKYNANTLGEEEKYINITGGQKEGPEIQAAMAWMKSKGWASYCSVVKGPLIRSPRGYTLTHMPLVTSSADHHIRTALEDAYEVLKESGEHDPELDVPPGEEPKWGQHSFRRQSDRVAQATKEKSKVSKEDINFFYGWDLKKMLAEMQLHYKGLDRMARLGLAWVTAWM